MQSVAFQCTVGFEVYKVNIRKFHQKRRETIHYPAREMEPQPQRLEEKKKTTEERNDRRQSQEAVRR